jgi:hypothetical protein
LKEAIWRHWEIDADACSKVENPRDIVLDDPKPLAPFAQGSPPPYQAYVKFDDDVYSLVAHVTGSFVV